MKQLILVLILMSSLDGAEVCEKCERIREYNKEHPGGEYEFYEDYLKAESEKKEAKSQK